MKKSKRFNVLGIIILIMIIGFNITSCEDVILHQLEGSWGNIMSHGEYEFSGDNFVYSNQLLAKVKGTFSLNTKSNQITFFQTHDTEWKWTDNKWVYTWVSSTEPSKHSLVWDYIKKSTPVNYKWSTNDNGIIQGIYIDNRHYGKNK